MKRKRRTALHQVSHLRRVPTGVWFTIRNIGMSVVSETHTLVVNIVQTERERWLGAVITTPIDNEHAIDVFDDHAHEVLGEFKTEAAARKKGEAYAKKWLRTQRELAKCACEPIRETTAFTCAVCHRLAVKCTCQAGPYKMKRGELVRAVTHTRRVSRKKLKEMFDR